MLKRNVTRLISISFLCMFILSFQIPLDNMGEIQDNKETTLQENQDRQHSYLDDKSPDNALPNLTKDLGSEDNVDMALHQSYLNQTDYNMDSENKIINYTMPEWSGSIAVQERIEVKSVDYNNYTLNLNSSNAGSQSGHTKPIYASFKAPSVKTILDNVSIYASLNGSSSARIYNSTYENGNYRPYSTDEYYTLNDVIGSETTLDPASYSSENNSLILDPKNTTDNVWFLRLETESPYALDWRHEEDSINNNDSISYGDGESLPDFNNEDPYDYSFWIDTIYNNTEEITNATHEYNNTIYMSIMQKDDFLRHTKWYYYEQAYNWLLNSTGESTPENVPFDEAGQPQGTAYNYSNCWQQTVFLNNTQHNVTITLPNDTDEFILMGMPIESEYDNNQYVGERYHVPLFDFGSKPFNPTYQNIDGLDESGSFVFFDPYDNRDDDTLLDSGNQTFLTEFGSVYTDAMTQMASGESNSTLAGEIKPLLNYILQLYSVMAFDFEMENNLEIGDIFFHQNGSLFNPQSSQNYFSFYDDNGWDDVSNPYSYLDLNLNGIDYRIYENCTRFQL